MWSILSFDLQIYALNKVMTELEQQQFEAFCKQMQSQGEWCSAFLFWLLQNLLPSEKHHGYGRTHTLLSM